MRCLTMLVPFLAPLVTAAALANAASAVAPGDVEPVDVAAADGASGDLYGSAVDLQSATLVVGAPRASGPGSADAGAVYVYTRSGTVWVEEAKLGAPVGAPTGSFGVSAALDGDTLAVGFPADDDFGLASGSVHVFVRSGTTWSLEQELLAGGGLQADELGTAVALAGDRLVAGAPGEDENGNRAGAAFVFVRSGTTWTQEARLLGGDGEAEDELGTAVAIEGDRIVVGAPGEDSVGADSGAAYVFERAGTSWSQTAQVFAVGPGSPGARFGTAVALSGNTLAGGGPEAGVPQTGAAWTFELDGGTWTQTAHLVPDAATDGAAFGAALDLAADTLAVGGSGQSWGPAWDPGWETGTVAVYRRGAGVWTESALVGTPATGPGDRFGAAVALEGNLLAVGAPEDGVPSGPGYVAVGVVPEGPVSLAVAEQEKLVAPDAEPDAHFGEAVAIDGATMVVGSDRDLASDRGSAYVYEHDGAGWVLAAHLTAPDSTPSARFGAAVDVDGDTLVVGAPLDANASGFSAGAAYVFARSGTDWVLQQKLLDVSPTAANDHFGWAVALDGDRLAVVAENGPGAGANTGSVTLFARSGTTWTAQARLAAANGVDGGYVPPVDLSGDTVVAGFARSGTPAVSVWTRSGTSWGSEVQFSGSDTVAGDRFGRALALEGDALVVGAYLSGVEALDHGAVYVFTRSGTSWSEEVRLRPDGPAYTPYALGGFGRAVALDGGRLAVLADRVSDERLIHAFTGAGASWAAAGRFDPTGRVLTAPDTISIHPFALALDGGTLALGAPVDDDAGTDAGALYLFDPFLVPFVSYCAATPNSTGLPAHIEASGTNSVAANDLVLTVTDMPAGQSGLVIASPDQASTPLGNGILCLGDRTLGFVVRLDPSTSSPAGVLVHELDMTRSPAPGVDFLPGATWNFSCWFRDVPAGGAGFDFSDGVQVTLAP